MTRPTKYRTGSAVVALGLLATLAACGDSDTKETTSADSVPDKVSMVLRNDVDTFDPFLSQAESGAKQMFDALYDTLVRVSPGESDGEVVVEPSLAEKWEVTPDSATFTLRDGLACGDGTPLTATGVAASLEHLADPDAGAFSTSRVFGPAGAKKITADDQANTVTVELKEPFTYLLEGLSVGYIVCPPALDDLETLAGTPAPTGPYTVSAFSRGERYVLERRDDLVVADETDLPAEIEMRVVADDTTRANLVSTKQVDVAPILGRDAERLEGSLEPIIGPAAIASSLIFNQAEGLPGADKDFRTAIAQAVDPAAYATASSFDLGQPIDTVYTPNMDCYDESNGDLTPGYDAAAAKAALASTGDKIRVIGIDTQNSGPDLVADSLREAGLKVDLFKGNLSQIIGIVFGTGDWDVFVYPYEVVMPLPSWLVNQIGPGDLVNDDYTRLVEQAAATEGDGRCDLWSQAEAALLENVDLKPLVWTNAAWFANGLTFDANYFYVDTRTIRSQ
jgi:peptide/nickel transport system substrate-binding protein